MAKPTSYNLEGKLRINFCKESDMRCLPHVGKIAAERMSEFRSKHGNITKRNILDIPNLNISRNFIAMIDFAENPAYSSVPCRTDLSEQEMKLESTPSAVGWEDQSPETWSRSDVSGAPSKSRRQSRLSSLGKRVSIPAYSPGGTPTRPVPKASRQRRPAYSPGGTPTRPVPKVTRQRRPAYSPGGTPVRRQNFGLLVSSSESSDEDSSSEESDFTEAEFFQERFLLASQAPEESLYEWADRLRVLALKAFQGNCHNYINKLFIRQFCLECIDQKAGQYALDSHPETLESAVHYMKQYFRIYHKKPVQLTEDSCSKDVSTDGLNAAQSQRNPSPAIKSPVCDSHITKSPVCDSSIAVTKSPVRDPLVIKSPVSDSPNSNSTAKSPVADPQIATTDVKVNKSKTKKTKAKKRKSKVAHKTENLPLDKDSKKCSVAIAPNDLLEHSSRVDEELPHTAVESNAPKGTDGSHQVNKSLSPMVDELNDEPDDSYGRLIRHTEPKYLYELQFCETVSSIPVVSVNSCEVSDTEEWTVDRSSLSVTEKPRILMGLKPDILKSSREHEDSTELVSPRWNISENHAVCSTGVSSDVSDLSQISHPSLSSLGPRVEIERSNERMTECSTEEVIQSSTTTAVKEDDLFLEIEEILAAEVARETFDKQSSISEAEKEENLFLEIEQIIAAEIVNESSAGKITREAAVESPLGESITGAAVDACITTEIVSPVGEIVSETNVGYTCTETVVQALTCTTESVSPVGEINADISTEEITSEAAMGKTNIEPVSPAGEIASGAVFGIEIDESEQSCPHEQSKTGCTHIQCLNSSLLCGGIDQSLVELAQKDLKNPEDSRCKLDRHVVQGNTEEETTVDGEVARSTNLIGTDYSDTALLEEQSVDLSGLGTACNLTGLGDASIGIVPQTRNQSWSDNTNQDDIRMVSPLNSNLGIPEIENPADQISVGEVEPRERDHGCQPCPDLQTEVSQHFGLNLQSGDGDHSGAEEEDILDDSTTDTNDANYEEQGRQPSCSGPKQWDPGGSLAGTSI